MNNEHLKEKITSANFTVEFEENPQFLFLIVTPENFRSLMEFLRNDPELNFDFLFCVTGVDWLTHLMVVYHLNSTQHKHSLVVKVKIADRVNPQVSTVCDIWRTAEFHEREVYDLFGVVFLNHPDLRRILLDEDWKGYPLRKDYVDEANIVEL